MTRYKEQHRAASHRLGSSVLAPHLHSPFHWCAKHPYICHVCIAGSVAQKETLVAAGAVTALVRVLCSGATEEARASAAGALCGIAAGSSMHRKGITATRCAVSGLICLLSSQLPAAVEAAAAALKNLTASETGRALSCRLATAFECVRDCSVHHEL
jgi:hypothetical protein